MITAEEVLSKRTALIVIDVQNEFCHPDGTMGKKGMNMTMIEGMMKPLCTLIDKAHEAKIPVVYIKNTEDEWTDNEAWCSRPDGNENSPNECVTRRGTWGAELYNLQPDMRDTVIEKHRFSAFYNTRLDTALKAKNIETVVITGVSSNVCVMTSATHAVMLGYHVVVSEDACGAWSAEDHNMAMANLRRFVGKVVSSDKILSVWEKKKAN